MLSLVHVFLLTGSGGSGIHGLEGSGCWNQVVHLGGGLAQEVHGQGGWGGSLESGSPWCRGVRWFMTRGIRSGESGDLGSEVDHGRGGGQSHGPSGGGG